MRRFYFERTKREGKFYMKEGKFIFLCEKCGKYASIDVENFAETYRVKPLCGVCKTEKVVFT
jgi:hypothetical protein